MQERKKAGGSLKISADVIAKIAQTAACEIEGAIVPPPDKLAFIAHRPLASAFVTPIKVRLSPDHAAIEVSVITRQGFRACEIAKAVQENVKSSVQSMTGINVSKVNVKMIAVAQ